MKRKSINFLSFKKQIAAPFLQNEKNTTCLQEANSLSKNVWVSSVQGAVLNVVSGAQWMLILDGVSKGRLEVVWITEEGK